LTRLVAAARRIPAPVVDGVLALGLLAGTASAGHSWAVPGRHGFDLRGLVLSAGVLLPLTLRRARPLSVLVVTGTMYALYLACGYVSSLDFYGPLLAFATVAMLHRTRVVAYAWAPVAALMFASGMTTPGAPLLGSIAQAVLASALAWTFGASIRGLSMRNRRLAELSRRLERAQRQIAERATLEERVRIARELHDAAAHHMSVIGVQAELAHYVFDTDPAQARTSLAAIAQASREALAEMRDLLTVLRPGPAGTLENAQDLGAAPAADTASAALDAGADPGEYAFEFPSALGLFAAEPGLDRLSGLMDRVRAAGVEVELEVVGRRRLLPAATDACAYRIVQEALTNVAKHAPGARARVIIGYRAKSVEISVANSVPAAPDPAPAARPARTGGAGHGLLGMRERAAEVGGAFEAGPLTDGGYRVEAALPVG
jgi:signal transduction histidine kinase